jgi:metallo-beta-lactamase class B
MSVPTLVIVVAAGLAGHARAQQASPADKLTPEQARATAAANPEMFLKFMRTTMKWDEPAEPTKIVGPIYFVGTRGLGSWLIRGSEGDVLLNTCMEDSGPLIEASIRKLGFDPRSIKWLLAGHTHVDHVAGHAYIKKLTGAQIAVAAEEVRLLESGGKGDPNYDGVPGFGFEPVKADRVLRDGDVVKFGDIALTAHVTPGHNLGPITWTMDVVDGGKIYSIVFPDGSGVNPGYRIVKNPSYAGIEGDYRHTLYFLSTLKPDIWLHSHTATFRFEEKRARAATDGIRAWADPEGYRQWIAAEGAAFEAAVKRELAVSVLGGK